MEPGRGDDGAAVAGHPASGREIVLPGIHIRDGAPRLGREQRTGCVVPDPIALSAGPGRAAEAIGLAASDDRVLALAVKPENGARAAELGGAGPARLLVA